MYLNLEAQARKQTNMGFRFNHFFIRNNCHIWALQWSMSYWKELSIGRETAELPSPRTSDVVTGGVGIASVTKILQVNLRTCPLILCMPTLHQGNPREAISKMHLLEWRHMSSNAAMLHLKFPKPKIENSSYTGYSQQINAATELKICRVLKVQRNL